MVSVRFEPPIHAVARPSPALLAMILVLGATLWGVRWASSDRHASGDTFWYARAALRFAGESTPDATVDAARYIVGQGRGNDEAAWIHVAETIDRRYPAIFDSRPVYPLVAAAFIPFVGLDGMLVAALLSGLIFAVAIGVIAYRLTGSRAASLGAVLLAYALPSGQSLVFLYADGWMLAFLAIALGCATAYLLEGKRGWLLAFALTLVAVYGSKPANGAIVVAATVALAGLVLVARSPSRARVARLASVAAAIGAGQIILFAVIGAPGLNETLQDYFTGHFAVPDVADPLRLLIVRDISLVPWLLVSLLLNPIVLAVAVLGLAPLLVVRTAWAFLWVLAGVATTLAVLLHPVLSEIPRLMAPIWVAVALGGSLVIPSLLGSNRWKRAARTTGPIP